MCRVLTYLGDPILIEELLYEPDNSFIKQSYSPKYMSSILNLAGFGLVSWVNESFCPEKPFIYKTLQLPFYDKNLINLASKLKSYCFLAHLRGVDYSYKQTISQENLHPFIFSHNVAFAHNGDLYKFSSMKYDLLDYIDKQYKPLIKGTTDSEWVCAVFMTHLLECKDPDQPSEDDIYQAIIQTIKTLQLVRANNKIETHSPLNLFITNGNFVAAIRYVLDIHKPAEDETWDTTEAHSLWYTHGDIYEFYKDTYRMKDISAEDSIIIASEPLTADNSTWLEMPQSSFIFACRVGGKIKLGAKAIEI